MLIFSLDLSHLSDDEAFLNGGKDGFYDGMFDKTCRFPLLGRHFAKGGRRFYPTGYGHEHEIGTAAMFVVELTITAYRFLAVV